MNRNLGVHILTYKNTIKIEDTLKKSEAELKSIAHKVKCPLSKEEKYDEHGQLIRTEFSIQDLIDVAVGWDGLVEEIFLYDVSEHDLCVRNTIYSFDNLVSAGFNVIQKKERNIDWAPDTVDDIFDHVLTSTKVQEEPLIFGNDEVNRVAFVINEVDGVLTSMRIKRYSHEYPFDTSKYTDITW